MDSATGRLNPAGEENANFENVNAGENVAQGNANTGLGNGLNAVSVPATATTKAKVPLSAAQTAKVEREHVQRNKLKSAGVQKPRVQDVATLARLLKEGNAGKYETAFQKVVSGANLSNFRTAKAPKAPKNTTAKTAKGKNSVAASMPASKGKNGSSQTMPRLSTAGISQTNLRGSNMVNTNAMNATIDKLVGMADSLGQQLNEMKRMIKTLKMKKRAPRATTSKRKPANVLPPAPESLGVNTGIGTSTENAFENVGNGLLDLPPPPQAPGALETLAEVNENNENNENSANSAFTPPP
jgi:hypothetical protein